jgi:hypothetical protein
MGTALRVARDVEIDSTAVWAGVSPEGKKELIERLQSEGEKVAMVLPRECIFPNSRLATVSTTHLPLLQRLSASH